MTVFDRLRSLPAIRLPRGRRPNAAGDPGAGDTAILLPEVDEASGPIVPRGLDVAASYAWRLVIVAVALYGILMLLQFFALVTVPLAIAILIVAMLDPFLKALRRWGWPPISAAAVSLVLMVLLILAVFVGVGAQVVAEAPQLGAQTIAGIAVFTDWLAESPFRIQQAQIDTWLSQLNDWLVTSQAMIAGYAASAGAQVGAFLAGTVTALIAAFFFAFEGRRIWHRTGLLLVPAAYRLRADRAAMRGWDSLVSYMRTAVIIATTGAVATAVTAAALGVPLVAALFALSFFAAFIPLIGALAAGLVAVALALVTKGWVAAGIMLLVVVLLIQIEGNILQPLLMGKATQVHPLVILLGLTVGMIAGGIVGALLSIPIVAFAITFARGLSMPPPVLVVTTGDAEAPPPDPASSGPEGD